MLPSYLAMLAQAPEGPALHVSSAGTSTFTQDQWFVVCLVVLGCFTGMVIALAGIFAGVTTALHRRVSEQELKREMLDRGMSAQEIAQVVEATPPSDFLDRMAKQRKRNC